MNDPIDQKTERPVHPSERIGHDSNRSCPPVWTETWSVPDGVEATHESAVQEIVEDAVTDLEQSSVTDYLEGQRSESQGE
ncbi:MAG: hypothetical protein O2960_30715 [Verrucomicrobia bacterium]|nr:hypothetical protein [Verrucomicrobiota bacterium]